MKRQIDYSDFFPYNKPRQGQEEMMAKIENAVWQGRNFCAEAPNGFGKTCVVLSAILPWIKENEGKILYCARTHKQLDRVIEECSKIEKKTNLVAVSLRGRQHMCINEFVLENAGIVASVSEVCGHLKAEGKCPFYKKEVLNSEYVKRLVSRTVLAAPEIVDFGKKRNICPYELAKQLAKVADVVALSYLYVFDPFIRETFLPELETSLQKIVLVLDEAHNVPTTALATASDALSLRTIRKGITEAGTYHDTITGKFCRGLAKTLLNYTAHMEDDTEQIVDPDEIYRLALQLGSITEEIQPVDWMLKLGLKIKRGLLRVGKFPQSAIYRVGRFLERWREYSVREDYTFVVSTQVQGRKTKRVAFEIVALDPTTITHPIVNRVKSTVAVSGTMSPLWAYSEMFGFKSNADMCTFQNPFAKRNRLGIIVQGLDTAYAGRSQFVFQRMVEHCIAVAHATIGNTGIFTTSYSIAKALLSAGLRKRLRKKLFVEKQGGKNISNDVLIEKFKREGERDGAVLLGVQGGRNSEGGDFPGPSMSSVIVVGVPYAKPTPRVRALIRYFDQKFEGRGRDYAYVLPAMTRAIQSAGRPVRKLDDRGVIILLDQRFGTPYLKRFVPSWLQEVIEIVPDKPDLVGEKVHAFFRDNKNITDR